jgi:membrane protein involved in colicin uptake
VQSGEAGLPGKNAEHFYTEYEVDTLIEDLTGAAHEAIEKAAAEAARAAALASVDREMAAMAEAQRLHHENSRLKQSRVKTAVVTGVICFFGGLAVGSLITGFHAGY